jgi:Tol biopolymer transport system component
MLNRTCLAAAIAAVVHATALDAATINRVSTDAANAETSGASFAGMPDSAGARVVFVSNASTLAPNDANNLNDVFVKVIASGAVILASRTPAGASGTGTSNGPAISANGQFVAYNSSAADLVASDTNATSDIFRYSLVDQSVVRVSVASGNVEANGASVGTPALSADGRYIAFESRASNLDPIDSDTVADIYRHDTQTGQTILISQSSAGQLGSGPLGSNRPTISSDGRYVAFESSRVLEPGDANSTGDIYLRDVQSGTTIRVNTSAANVAPTLGFSARPSLSASGRLIAFRSLSNELTPGDGTTSLRDIFVKNLDTQAIFRVTPRGGADPNGDSNELDLSDDGQTLIFHSLASNLTSGDSNGRQDVFRLTIATRALERLSVTSSGEGNDDASFPQSNGDGTRIAFESAATNLVPADTNARLDVFLATGSELIFSDGFDG